MRRINGFRLDFEGRGLIRRPREAESSAARGPGSGSHRHGQAEHAQNACAKAAAGHATPGTRFRLQGAGAGRLFAAALALALLAACGGKIPPTNYYMLDLPAPAAKPANTLPFTAVVMPFRGSEMLGQDRIIYRETASQVGFYEYHRWAEDPRTTLLRSLLGQLRATGAFERVVPFEGRTSVDYIIRGSLDQLEEIDYGGGVSVKVKVSAQLVDAATNRVVWNETSEATGSVSTAEVSAVVEQMSTAMRSAVSQLVEGINTHLRSNAAQSALSSAPSAQGAQR
ncbi:MAG: ABC-type transport auxiliary lipoprotein family protein [Bryobacterales bacterium]